MLKQKSALTRKHCRCLRFLLATGSGLTCTGVQAQSSHEVDLFPVYRNASWTYEVTVGRHATALSATVTHVHTTGDFTDATFEWLAVDGRRTQTEAYHISAGEVARVASGREGECRYVPPFPVLKFPLTNGRHWNWKGVLQFQKREIPAEATFSASGPIGIPTPSGALQTLKVHCDLTLSPDGQPRTETTDLWFAPGIGIVQERVQRNAEGVEGRLTGYSVRRGSVPPRAATTTWNGLLLHMLSRRR